METLFLISFDEFKNSCEDVFLNDKQPVYKNLSEDKKDEDRFMETRFTDGIHIFSIWVDTYSNEIGSNIECFGQIYRPQDLVYIYAPDLIEKNSDFAFKDLKTLRIGISLNKIYIEKSLEILNSQGRKIIKKVKELHFQNSLLLEKESLLSNISPQANDAFRNKNWKEAVKLYKLIMPYLSEANIAKFEYAKVKVAEVEL